MRVAVFGAGAIGGLLAHALHKGGAEVSLVARGPHLDAIRANGLTVETGGGTVVLRLPATDRAEDLGPQDNAVIALKVQSVPPVADRIRPLELDARVSAVQELARRLGLATPVLDTVAALARMQGQVLVLHDRRPGVEAAIGGPCVPVP